MPNVHGKKFTYTAKGKAAAKKEAAKPMDMSAMSGGMKSPAKPPFTIKPKKASKKK